MATTTSEEMHSWAIHGLEKALNDLEAEKDRLMQALSVLKGKPELAPRGNKMSEEGRRRISEAQKKRWASKKLTTAAPTPSQQPGKRGRKPQHKPSNGPIK